ncbi:alpha/beta hydrolase [Nocardioides sp. NBC_00850]|uniref:alpha/beta fold hydrolase n=1 Tax=Nocardioides sp. NBC_00850 TaxID=2976001 RepID=UPI0038681902|nr:alpha/beta hydrolase [Nocardioides sp. NBC_00850]
MTVNPVSSLDFTEPSTAGFRTEQVVVGDVRIPVLRGGPRNSAEAVVFVHGNPGAGSDWLDLMRPVAEFSQVIAPDMPGFGGAEKRADQDYTLAGYARHLGGLIDALGLTRVHLVAHDFGGPWSLTWAAAHPDRVASVTLVNTGVMLDYTWHRVAKIWRVPVVGEIFQRIAPRRFVREMLAHDNPGLHPDWVARIANHLQPWGTRRAVLRLYRTTTSAMMEALVEPLRASDLPCLVVWGPQDVYLPAVQAQRQREPFPSAQIHTIPDAGHWSFLERPDMVAPLVLAHLRSHHSTARTRPESSPSHRNEQP